ncbi:MAG: ankyrin repeat domain-containing protein [Candidatus Chromulinivorax sp.]|nr:ankyrin repeat domain-containing protein [Candidatus Chromulinivorax sp.]
MKKIFLALFALCCATQITGSSENIVPKSNDSEYRERISPIAKSCSSEYFDISHKDRIPAQHGIPTLHEIAFKKLEPRVIEVITDLINHKYDDEHDKQNKRNYIDRVAHYDSYLLLSKFINAPIESNGVRLLHAASKANNPEITQYLLDNGALVKKQSNCNQTPLHYAAWNNADRAIPLLITHGADVNQQDDHGWTPLRYAAYQNADKAIPILITAGALVNQPNNYGSTPLHYAADQNADKAIPLLIDAGALVNLQSNDGFTPLHCAAYQNADKAIPLLIDAGALVNQPNNYGYTPLHYAAYQNADKAISLLITAGALVNQQNDFGKTPLHYAADQNADKAITVLITAGADTTIQNNCSRTARMLTNNPATLQIFDQAVAARQLKQQPATKSTSTWSWFYRSQK